MYVRVYINSDKLSVVMSNLYLCIKKNETRASSMIRGATDKTGYVNSLIRKEDSQNKDMH